MKRWDVLELLWIPFGEAKEKKVEKKFNSLPEILGFVPTRLPLCDDDLRPPLSHHPAARQPPCLSATTRLGCRSFQVTLDLSVSQPHRRRRLVWDADLDQFLSNGGGSGDADEGMHDRVPQTLLPTLSSRSATDQRFPPPTVARLGRRSSRVTLD